MATEVNLPELGESVTEGTVTRWLKQVGDQVAVDEPLLEVSTDKVDTEIPSPVAGTLLEIKVGQDDTVDVGATLAVIGSADEAGSPGEGGGAAGDADQAAPDQGTPLDEERTERAEARDQAEQAATPDGADAEPQGEQPAPASEPTTGAADSESSGERAVVRLPELGESVTEGTVTRWLKQVGDQVAVDEALLEVSTDKVDTEIPSPAAGTLLEIRVDEDETVEVGAELGVIGSGEASAPSAPPTPSAGSAAETAAEQPQQARPQEQEQPQQPDQAEESQAPAEQPAQPQPAQPQPAQPQSAQPAQPAEPTADGGGRQASAYVTPLVRKMAAQHGVDLGSVVGTGVGGRIRKQDVLDAAERQTGDSATAQPAAAASSTAASSAPVPSPLRGKTEPMSRLRKVIAQRMVESLQVSAQLTTVVEVDVTSISRLRDSAKEEFAAREGVKLSFMPFFAKAAVDALKEHPSLNAAIDTEKGEVTYYDRENLAIAVDTERGLLTPVIKEAGDLSIAGLARKIADVAERTRTNKITPDELSGGTFTLTNTGSRGALFDTPIINQPQVAILGTGTVVKRPVVIDDPNLGETIAVRQMVYLALTYDHRLVDGADAARFLTDVRARLEAGQFEIG
jgi:2-oxoglutarate dehydrogenase E2 component (dihydrolipoamide succinyltransferase)